MCRTSSWRDHAVWQRVRRVWKTSFSYHQQ